MLLSRQNPFAYEHSFIDYITLEFTDYKSATLPLWSAVMLSVLCKAWRFVAKELAAFKEPTSVKQNGRKQAVILVEPRFHEVPSDWGNLFVVWRVRYTEHLDLTNFRKKKTTTTTTTTTKMIVTLYIEV